MLITINDVKIEKHPKGYSVANVSYTRDGRESTRQIMSFVNVDVFKALSNMRDFPNEVNVVMVKNEKSGYWDWVGIERNDQVKGQDSERKSSKPTGGKVIGSNYETPEERAKRQVFIIRQSSISSAIEYFKAKDPKGTEKSVSDVLEVARDFEEYVMGVEPTTDEVV